jgi:hypothetical protein
MARRPRSVPTLTQTTELVRRLADDVQYRARRRKRRRKRTATRVVLAILAMMVTTFVIIPTMIAMGFLLGPRGVEGLIAAPLLLITSWAAILYWAFARKQAPPKLPALAAKSQIAQLPAQTDEWLDAQRTFLPFLAQAKLDSIGMRLEALSTQLQGSSSESERPAAAELRRLLGEELPELVRGYRKVPRALQQQPLHGGSTPERQLIEGLTTIDEQIGRMHEQLAADDLQALAVHQRYLDLKYKRDKLE